MKKTMMILAIAGLIMASATTAQAAKKKVVKKCAKVSAIVKMGIIGEGTTMHCLELKTIGSKSETLFIPTDDNTNMKQAYIVIGNIAKVTCKKTADGLVAKKVEGNADYYNAIGKWTTPDPIDKTKKMGVELEVNGKAQSINMASLPYSSWELQGKPGKLLLIGKSIGNGGTYDEKTVVTIYKNKKGKWMMKDDSSAMVYTKEAE